MYSTMQKCRHFPGPPEITAQMFGRRMCCLTACGTRYRFCPEQEYLVPPLKSDINLHKIKQDSKCSEWSRNGMSSCRTNYLPHKHLHLPKTTRALRYLPPAPRFFRCSPASWPIALSYLALRSVPYLLTVLELMVLGLPIAIT